MDEFDSLTDAVFLVLPTKTLGATSAAARGKATGSANPRDHFRLDGFQQLQDVDEPWEATELRRELFHREWDLISARIENVMLNMNTIALYAIYHFVQNAHTPKVTRAVMPFQELPAGLVFAGINVPDHDLLFQQIARMLSSPTPPALHHFLDNDSMPADTTPSAEASSSSPRTKNLVIILQSKDCANLKSALKMMIELFLGLQIEGARNPLEGGTRLQNYDMLVLERWYESVCYLEESNGQRPNLVVIIQDFESFDQDTLQDFITICSNYQDRIPFVFLMGLATSIEALHQGLPKSVMSLLQTRKFQMQQSSECLTAIVEDLFIQANVGLMVGPLPLKQLIDQFMHYNFSVGGFVSNLKYVVMHHFYANPLSILCDRSLSSQSKALNLLGKGHFDHIRMLPSFQRHVESKVVDDPQVAEMLLLDDEFLASQIPEMVEGLLTYHNNFALVFDFLWFVQSRFSISILKKSKRVLYFMALDGTLTDSSFLSLLLSLVRKMNSNDMMLFVEGWLDFFKSSERCTGQQEIQQAMAKELAVIQSIRDRMAALLDVVSEDSVTSSSEIEDNTDQQEGEESGEGAGSAGVSAPSSLESASVQLASRTGPSNSTTTTIGFVKKRKLVSIHANDMESRQTRIAQKTRETARMPKGVLGAYTILVKEIDETIGRLFRTYLDSHTKIPLNEIFYYSQVTVQQKAFLPQPRASIQTALGQPELYLNCECCQMPAKTKASSSLADMVLPTQHDTCILYKLYVECGRMINMFDWFTAFGMILERGQQAEANDEDDESESEEEEEVPQTPSRRGRKANQPPPLKKVKSSSKVVTSKRMDSASKKKKTDGTNNSRARKPLDQQQVQARFISGVAELQFMGFIKPTNRKTDHVVRLTWGSI